jgi:dihydroorotate dehydrogenase (NAD+) catalytic subunit
MNINASLCGVGLENPTVLASGILGSSAASLARVANAGAGAVTKKSICMRSREGHDNPTMVEVEGGYLNCLGLPAAGINESLEDLGEYKRLSKVPVIASFYGTRMGEFGEIAGRLEGKADLLEVNISCPNVHDGLPFSASCDSAAGVVKEIKRATRSPLLVKLSPNVPDIGEIAKSCVKAGADGITAINTVGPGMVIDLKTRKPVLSNKTGGMSGPAIKPIMIRCVYDIYKATKGKVPILATGGILTGEDAAEAIMAGASAVGIGTGIKYRGLEVFGLVAEELKTFMNEEGFGSIREIRGVVHG